MGKFQYISREDSEKALKTFIDKLREEGRAAEAGEFLSYRRNGYNSLFDAIPSTVVKPKPSNKRYSLLGDGESEVEASTSMEGEIASSMQLVSKVRVKSVNFDAAKTAAMLQSSADYIKGVEREIIKSLMIPATQLYPTKAPASEPAPTPTPPCVYPGPLAQTFYELLKTVPELPEPSPVIKTDAAIMPGMALAIYPDGKITLIILDFEAVPDEYRQKIWDQLYACEVEEVSEVAPDLYDVEIKE